jgi:hypothetical protein
LRLRSDNERGEGTGGDDLWVIEANLALLRDLRFIAAIPPKRKVHSYRRGGSWSACSDHSASTAACKAIRVCYSKRGDEEVVNKISDVHLDRLLPWQASRTWLRRTTPPLPPPGESRRLARGSPKLDAVGAVLRPEKSDPFLAVDVGLALWGAHLRFQAASEAKKEVEAPAAAFPLDSQASASSTIPDISSLEMTSLSMSLPARATKRAVFACVPWWRRV